MSTRANSFRAILVTLSLGAVLGLCGAGARTAQAGENDYIVSFEEPIIILYASSSGSAGCKSMTSRTKLPIKVLGYANYRVQISTNRGDAWIDLDVAEIETDKTLEGYTFKRRGLPHGMRGFDNMKSCD